MEQPVWLEQLKTTGWAIVPNVISNADEYASRFWSWLESLESGIRRDDPKTWTNDNWPIAPHGIIQHYNIGHQQFMWDLRCEPGVIDVFAKIYKTDRLLTSFDGANLSRPGRGDRPWPHLDQTSLNKRCVQGAINLMDCGEEDGGLVVYPGSHMLFEKFITNLHKEQIKKVDWLKLTDKDMEFYYDNNCARYKPCPKAGDMLLWDSRTVHYAIQPVSNRYRMAAYVSMMPAKLDLKPEKRINAFNEHRMTSHWADNIKLVGKQPNTYGDHSKQDNYKVNWDPPVLTSVGKKLVGIESYNKPLFPVLKKQRL